MKDSDEKPEEKKSNNSGNNSNNSGNNSNNSRNRRSESESDSDSDSESEEEIEEMEEPSAMLNTFTNSGKEFRMGKHEGGQMNCVRIKMGDDDKFAHKDNVHTQSCSKSDKAQYWKYSGDQIKTSRPDKKGKNLCLDWNNDKYKVTECDSNKHPQNRQFSFTAPSSGDVEDVTGKPRWTSSHSVSNAIPVRIKSGGKCIANPASGKKETRATSCGSSATKYYIMTD